MTRKNFYRVAAWLMAAVAMVACTGDDLSGRPAGRTWLAHGTVSVDSTSEVTRALVAGEQTRALSVGGNSGKTLYFNWNGGEELQVYDGTSKVGKMTATVNPGNTALADLDGDIEGSYAVGNTLTYYYPDVAMDFTGQKGTVANLSEHFQYLESQVAVTAVDASNNVLGMGFASLKYRMAVVRLQLTDTKGNRLHVEELEMMSESGKLVESVDDDGTVHLTDRLTIVTEKENGEHPGEIFIALLNTNDAKDTYTLTAKVGRSVYSSTTDVQKITARFLPDHFYTGVRQLTKTVDGDEETMGDFTFSTIDPLTYNGSAQTPDVTITYNNGTDVTSDCELHYFANTDAGQACVIAVGKDGTAAAGKAGFTTFTINPKALTDDMVTNTFSDQAYTGSAIEPGVALTDHERGKDLVSDIDYTVSYADNTDVGTATVTINGTGNYMGRLTRTFNITPAAGTLTLNKSSVTLNEVAEGATKETAVVSVTAHSGPLSVKSNDEAVATVSLSGETITITGIAAGTTTIAVTSAANGNYAAVTKYITVTVNPLASYDMGSAPSGCQLVDLGLSVLWASMNVGATVETDYGNYYAWAAKSVNSSNRYSFQYTPYYTGSGSSHSWSKYSKSDGKTVLEGTDDAATYNWRGDWRMPTKAECDELLSKTKRTWKTNYNGSGKNGYLFTSTVAGYTSKSIFLPAAGYRDGLDTKLATTTGIYWTSTLGIDQSTYDRSYTLFFQNGTANTQVFFRDYGFPVRPVMKKK